MGNGAGASTHYHPSPFRDFPEGCELPWPVFVNFPRRRDTSTWTTFTFDCGAGHFLDGRRSDRGVAENTEIGVSRPSRRGSVVGFRDRNRVLPSTLPFGACTIQPR